VWLKVFLKHGEKLHLWLNNFKIAIVQEDISAIESLLDNMPDFNSVNSMREAKYLIKEAVTILEKRKASVSLELMQIQKNLDFLNSATANSKSKFDIKS